MADLMAKKTAAKPDVKSSEQPQVNYDLVRDNLSITNTSDEEAESKTKLKRLQKSASSSGQMTLLAEKFGTQKIKRIELIIPE